MATRKSPGKSKGTIDAQHSATKPSLHQHAGTGTHETQRFGEIVPMPHGMPAKVAKTSCASLNQVLADTITLRDMYKKHHWQVVGPTFNELHLMYDKHYEAQVERVDALAERTIGEPGRALQRIAGLVPLGAPGGRDASLTCAG